MKHGLSGTREYQREKLREWRALFSAPCECSKPATMSYYGAPVCSVCYHRQKIRDYLVDLKETRTETMAFARRLFKQANLKYLVKWGTPVSHGRRTAPK